MDSIKKYKNGRWIIPFQKFSKLRGLNFLQKHQTKGIDLRLYDRKKSLIGHSPCRATCVVCSKSVFYCVFAARHGNGIKAA